MNYRATPDLPPGKDLTIDAVSLFQRFRQSRDLGRVDRLWQAEVNKHIALCELAIMTAAGGTYYWCDLPEHALLSVTVTAHRHLEEQGFEIKHIEELQNKEVVDRYSGNGKKIKVKTVRFRSTASWGLKKLLNQKAVSKEWKRRENMEDTERKKKVPKLRSKIVGDKFEPGDVAWAAVLDQKYVVEVQRILHRDFLCIFKIGGKFLFSEPTNVAYGAMFGPDVGDVAMWQERALQIVASLSDGRSAKLKPATI
jgi:hypothetical protein